MDYPTTYFSQSVNYLTYHSPPYSSTDYTANWSEYSKPPPDESKQMQYIRYPTPVTPPTPPTTPPRRRESATLDLSQTPASKSFTNTRPTERSSLDLNNTRTQSVIMKVGQGQSPHHVNLDADMYSTEDTQTMSHLINISGSESSSPASEFICAWSDCGRYFDSLESLAQHVTQIHAVANVDDGLYYCRWNGCQRSERGFNARYKMLVHVRTHTKEKPHKCHLCEKSFSRAENLKIHIRSHSGEKPYKCTFEGCTKAYSNSSDRFKHTRTHTMEKPYKCKVPGCQKRYTDPSSLRKHVKTFKHSIQIMENHLPSSLASNIYDSSSRLSPESKKEESNEPREVTNTLPYSGSPYYLNVIHADQEMVMEKHRLPSFYERSTTANSSFYWLPEEALVHSYPVNYKETFFPLHPAPSYPMELDLDRPLDLRVNKVQ